MQIFVPGLAHAREAGSANKTNQLVKVGELDPKSYPSLDNKTILEIQKQARKNQNKSSRKGSSLFSVDNPYLPGQNPTDEEKAAAFGNLKVKFKAYGLKENGVEKEFQWNEIFGTDSNGRPSTADIYFVQKNAKTDAELNRFKLTVNSSGDYILKDLYGNPADLPLYSNTLEPYKYDVELDYEKTEKISFLTVKLSYSGDEDVSQVQRDGKIIYNIPLDLQIAQIASTKFVSEWHTDVSENERPAVNGDFDTLDNQDLRYFPFPKNDADVLKLRKESYNLETDEWPGYDPQTPPHLRVVPKVSVEEDMLEDSATYTIDKDEQRITSNGKSYKYDFNYDVINGGKLTMTEILPITFDANEGKFSSITDPKADQQIVKEVEYGKDLTEEVEEPKKDLETFKGWATEKNGKPLSKEDFKEAITNVKEKKIFYAVWENNDIVAEEIEVKESFKNTEGKLLNNFLPSIDALKAKVKIKDVNDNFKPVQDSDKFEIIDGSNVYDKDDDNLKNYLYEKLKEKEDTEVSRVETLKARVTRNGKAQTVEIPIKVIKNIYEAKTKEGKPVYVPKNYIKVTLDPTTKATDPQKYFYYVNPDALVKIPGNNPTGTDGNRFVKWIVKGSNPVKKYVLDVRNQFTADTTIEAQYVSDVIQQEGKTKPEEVPDNFVEVKFVPTDKATDKTKAEKIYWVNPTRPVTIPVENPVGKQYFTFAGWKVGKKADGESYSPTTPKQFTANQTVITATYTEAKNIIPYDPTEPKTRPDGYVRVTFEAEDGIKLKEQKAYYVKKNAKDDQGQPLTLAALAKPDYKEENGYKFDKWDKEDATTIGTEDIVVTAIAKSLPDFVEKTDENPNKPDDSYVTVTFKADKSGNGTVTEKVYFVNPQKYVNLTPPDDAKGNTGYEFGAWSMDVTNYLRFTKDTIITASFNKKGAVVPKVDDNTKKPDGYVEVSFEIEGQGGSILENEVKTYFVNPEEEVSLTPPRTQADTGYVFKEWDKDTSKKTKYTDGVTTIKGRFDKYKDIIPSTDEEGNPNQKPEGYVTLTFDKGDHGKLDGKTVYYVNPEANKTLGEITKPKVKADTGWTQKSDSDAWDTPDNFTITKNKTVTAQYEAGKDVIPKFDDDGKENDKPDGYIEVKFSTETNGRIKGTDDKTEKVVYVNPNKAVVLKDYAPEVEAKTGYTFAAWDTSINKAIQYEDKDVIKAKYNEIGSVIPKTKEDDSEKPTGFVTVSFDKGDNGKELKGTTVYFVDPNKEVTVPEPEVVPNVGYSFDKWDQKLTKKFEKDTIIKATYKQRDDIIPQKNTDGSDKPDGYVTVTFISDKNGSLSGTTVYYIKKDTEVDLTKTAEAIGKSPFAGFTAKGGTWSPAELKNKFAEDASYTFNFKKLTKAETKRIEMIDEGIISTPIEVFVGDKISDSEYVSHLRTGDDREIESVTVTEGADTSKPGFTSALVTVKIKGGDEIKTKVLVFAKERCENVCPNPGGGDYTPIPVPDSTEPGDDEEKDPEDKEKTPDEENGKEKEDNPDKDKDKTPEKPGDKDPKKPGQNQPPVKNDSKKKQGQTGTKIVKTINQTGTKVINQVKNFLNPTTGIISNYGLYIGLMAASSVGLFFTREKKNKNDDED